MLVIEEDDFPKGFLGESQWANVELALRLHPPKGGRCCTAGFSGMVGRLDDGLTDSQRFYRKATLNADWRSRKNAYYRARYAAANLQRRGLGSRDAKV